MDAIPLFYSFGAEVFHMCNTPYGSLKLTQGLPDIETFCVNRIILHPLLLQSVKKPATMARDTWPTSILAGKRKHLALRKLLETLMQDQSLGLGGYRVEVGWRNW